MGGTKVFGYRRENGRVGVRNYVAIIPLDDLSNSACEAVANNITGTIALPHAYGRLQFGEDLELFFRTMIGTGANPNVAAVVVIGIEPEWTNRIVEGIAATGKPVTGFAIERTGDIGTIAKASRQAMEYVQWASELQREECDLSEIWVSTKCGESDTTSGLASNPTVGNAFEKLVAMGATCSFGETSEITGAEMVCKERAATPEVAEQFMATFNKYQDMIDRNKTDDLSGSQPTKGNIAGGLTTIEEKAFGNLQKIGKKTDYYTVGAEFDGGELLYVHPTGAVARRNDDFFLYPIGGRLDEAFTPDVETALEYPALKSVADQLQTAAEAQAAKIKAEEEAKAAEKAEAEKKAKAVEGAKAATKDETKKAAPAKAASVQGEAKRPSSPKAAAPPKEQVTGKGAGDAGDAEKQVVKPQTEPPEGGETKVEAKKPAKRNARTPRKPGTRRVDELRKRLRKPGRKHP